MIVLGDFFAVVMTLFVQHDEAVDLSSILTFLPTYILDQLCDGVVMLFGIFVTNLAAR